MNEMTPDDLRALITDVVSTQLREAKKTDELEKFISRKELQQIFKPSPSIQSICNWEARGLLKKYYMSGRVLYKYTEVLEAFRESKKFEFQAQ
jgi:hypothetical protein